MARRRTSVSRQSGTQPEASSSSKRPRQYDDDEADERSQKRSRRNETEDIEAQIEDDEGPAVNTQVAAELEQKFEKENESRVRERIERARKAQGGVAEHGIIEYVEMHQFMCHKYLTFSFGPQINFIIGHNGSGKSAVLTAITVALGGKAATTGRGSGLKSLIREGQSVAEVTVRIKNQGDEAYRPQDYGKSINITRRFTKEGSTTWKIKSKDNKVISTKKEELARICDHMNIQVDNPMNILTQDSARQFLSASSPADKYKFFLKGTQLQQLSEEYELISNNVKETTRVLMMKREALPDLRTAFEDATRRFEEASKAREQKHKVDELKKELAWAHVRAKREEMEEKIKEVSKLERKLPKVQSELANAQTEFDSASAEVQRLEAEHEQLGNVAHLTDKKKELQETIRKNRNKLNDFRNEESQMKVSLRQTNKTIDDYQAQIQEEQRRLTEKNQEKHDQALKELEKARGAVTAAETHLSDITRKKGDKTREAAAAKAEGMDLQKTREQAKRRIEDADHQIRGCHEQERNKLAHLGHDIEGLLRKIMSSKWYGETPMGPLGMYVKVRDSKWAPLLRVLIGSQMFAFACTDSKDRPLLRRILDQSGNRESQIIISERDIFDYSAGEPPQRYPTILRALDVSDEFVLRLLINQARIERTLLAPTRLEGENMMESLNAAGVVNTLDGFRHTRYPEGGSSNIVITFPRGNDPRQRLFENRDIAGQLQHWQKEKATAEEEYRAVDAKIQHLRTIYDEASRAITALTTEETRAHKALRNAKTELKRLQDEVNEEVPVEMATLEEALREAVAEKENILAQFAALEEQKVKVEELQRPVQAQLDDIRKQIERFEEQRSSAREQVENAVAARIKAQNARSHWEKMSREAQEAVDKAQESAEILTQEYQSWSEKALDYCHGVTFENPRKTADVNRELEAATAALKAREKRNGATVEEVTIEVNKARHNLETAEHEFKTTKSLVKALRNSLNIRLVHWQEFRRHIALRCKLIFQTNLANRGYFGKILFDHINQTLNLKVQTDIEATTQGAMEKDPRSLSGGEKSFSTICFLLSLWDSIGCPLRCLDEFDVFMDAVNRRISMKMMIETANASDKKQYVLITPQDMTGIGFGPTVRVHRMTDPERGQGTLS